MGARTKAAAVLPLLLGCNAILGNDPWQPYADGSTVVYFGSDAGADGGNRGASDSGSAGDAPTFDRTAPADSGPFDSTVPFAPDSTADTGAQADSARTTGLDPCLVLPDAAAPTCSPINSPQACPDYGFCAIATASGTTGQCTSCPQGSCGGPLHSFCQTNDDCDDIFQCYCGQCLTLCLIDAGECTPYCMNVGNATWGVCNAPP